MAGKAFQFVVNRGRQPDAACRDPTICTQDVQQMSERGLNEDDRPLTPTWTLARGEMRRQKSAHDRFIETTKC